LLVAREHLVDRIVRLEERKASSYFAVKGYTILLPQDMTRLLDILPMPLYSLPDIVRYRSPKIDVPLGNNSIILVKFLTTV
jgi:hypothetical protein